MPPRPFSLFSVLGDILSAIAKMFDVVGKLLDAGLKLLAVILPTHHRVAPKARQEIKHEIRKSGHAAIIYATKTPALRESPTLAPVVKREAPETGREFEARHKAPEVQHKESEAKHEVSERHEMPGSRHAPETHSKITEVKHEVPAQHGPGVRHEESSANHEVSERHATPKVEHKPVVHHKDVSPDEVKHGASVYYAAGVGNSTLFMPPINARVYSIMTSSVPGTYRVGPMQGTQMFAPAYSTRSDPAHEIASTLLKNTAFSKMAPAKTMTVRYPNMNHSLSSMFFGMPLARPEPKGN